MALREREVRGGKGQVIDVALYESVFNMMESLIPEFSVTGLVREPSGSALPGIAPTNAYRCNNGLVLIAGNGDGIFRRLMTAIGREDLAHDRALQDMVDLICQDSRRRIRDAFRNVCCNNGRLIGKVSENLLNGNYDWITSGIVLPK